MVELPSGDVRARVGIDTSPAIRWTSRDLEAKSLGWVTAVKMGLGEDGLPDPQRSATRISLHFH